MLIARVVGEMMATHKHASHEGRKLLLEQPLNLDVFDAGVRDRVLLAAEFERNSKTRGRKANTC